MFKINLPNKIFTETKNQDFNLMKFIIFLIPFLFSHNTSLAQYQVGQDLYGDSAQDRFGNEVSISGDGKVMAIGSSGSSGNDRYCKIYKKSNCVWVEDVKINVGLEGVRLALSNDGSRIVIGVPSKGAPSMGSAGAVYVFDNINDDWNLVGSPIIGEIYNAYFGSVVSISGDGKIIACDYSYSKEKDGRTEIFELINNNWVQIGDDIVGENTEDAAIITSKSERLALSYDGSIVAIGSAGSDANGPESGHVRVFKNINSSWEQVGTNILGTLSSENFGRSVSLSHQGTIIAINAGNSGGFKVFEFKDTSWLQVGKPMTLDKYAKTKCSISSDGSIVAIGTYDWNSPVNVFKNINGVWTKLCEPINGDATGDYFGYSISLSDSGDILAIGAYSNDFNGNTSGQVKVFNVRNVINTVNDCEFFTWTDGVTYYESNNTAKDTFITSDGCDSVVTLNLTITKVNADVIVVDELTLRAQAAESGTTYQWLNCADLKPIPGETNATFTATSSGEYAVEVTFNNCVKKSECFTISSKADINVLKSNYKIQLFPNPTSDKLILSLEGIERADISLTDIHGKVILHKLGLFDKDFISLSNLESGIYFVKVKTSEFSKEIRVIKQ